MSSNSKTRPAAVFRRSYVILRPEDPAFTKPRSQTETPAAPVQSELPQSEAEYTVLVLNSSHEMAKEITLELTLNIPGCSIMYAPTIALARWLLTRRKIHLIVSCPLLADGSISSLQNTLKQMKLPPDLLVVGELNDRQTGMLQGMGYEMTTVRRLNSPALVDSAHSLQRLSSLPSTVPANEITNSIKNLGADLRNDLNNPLQAIVAMVFVAQASGETSASTIQALDAIDKAAKNLATVVSGLEDKIRTAVGANE